MSRSLRKRHVSVKGAMLRVRGALFQAWPWLQKKPQGERADRYALRLLRQLKLRYRSASQEELAAELGIGVQTVRRMLVEIAGPRGRGGQQPSHHGQHHHSGRYVKCRRT